ncbi:PstS family phosphate ABC transporter substrate-binding protein [Sphingobacterium hotanense]|uniref:Phosphate-binding protein n=1 Tax=Sphingobacterium hotanense TaxID=649196 RepID=A0ABT7NKG4_9SPHI|nr:PstS family phosphate ABC transporter substrate-binding protein [Sphingobacterium hotanense]MDM1047718.1 PstS family phosphate ABC transporter substrate-binding protein [Sphingobacterium hotanense]
MKLLTPKYLFLIPAISLCSCFKQYKDKVNIDGSSSVYLLTEAVAEEFRKIEPDIRITVGISGTGGGFKKFLRGETDISDASRPITKSELEISRSNGIQFIEIPVSYDGMAIVVSPKNDFVDYLTVEELKKMWSPESQGKINTWKQIRDSWPNVPLNLYGAGTSSGTYDYFTEAINGKAKSSRGDYTASEDDNVLVQGVSSDKNGLGYFGLAYYSENKSKLKLIPVKVTADAQAVYPTEITVQNGTYQPLSRPEFIYVNAKSATKPAVKKFIQFYMKNATVLAKEVGYVPLPPEVYELSHSRFKTLKTGSVFENKSIVGVNLLQLLSEK